MNGYIIVMIIMVGAIVAVLLAVAAPDDETAIAETPIADDAE